MGGYAYIIPGDLAPALVPDPERLPEPRPASFWRRLFGGSSSAETPYVTRWPNGELFFDIPPGELKSLVADFRAWVHTRVPRPSKGSAVLLQYLTDIEPTIYVRGLQRVGEQRPGFYVQVSFSGCAGQAETSARAAYHWAALWYAAERGRIESEYFAPFGFTAAPSSQGEVEVMTFLPAGDLGYLEYNTEVPREPGESAFDLDASLAEAHDGDPVLDRLDETFTPYMSPPRCRCQICEPEFGDAAPP